MAGKWPGREIAVVLHRVPAGLDAAHVGLIFTDVMGNGPLWRSNLHGYGLSMRWICIASRRRHLGADAHAHAPERNSILDVIVPANSTGLPL